MHVFAQVTVILTLGVVGAGLAVEPASISVNFALGTNDNNSVDRDESAGSLALGGIPAPGAAWNHALLRLSTVGTPTNLIAATQGGAALVLRDRDGNTAATLTSACAAGGLYAGWSDATDSTANRGAVGEAGLMQSYLALLNSESVTVSGLGAAFTNHGYRVVLFSDLGAVARTQALHVVEGPGGNGVDQTRWLKTQATSDGDVNDDGYLEWAPAVGTSAATATTNGNYVLVSGLRAAAFTIHGSNQGGRSALNGFQIVALPPELPALPIQVAFHNGVTTVGAMAAGAAPTNQGSVVNTAATAWNSVQNAAALGLSFTNVPLVLADGTPSGAMLSGRCGYSGYNSNGWGARSKDFVMMEGWHGVRADECVTVSGLPPAFTSGFHVVVYGDSNDTNRRMPYTAGAAFAAIEDSGTFGGSFAEGGNYAVLEGLAGDSFTLRGSAGVADARSAINGLAIVPGAPRRPPRILAFRADDGYVVTGATVRLSWEVGGADALSIAPSPGDVTGLTTVGTGAWSFTASTTTVFTLSASNANGTSAATLRVGVGPPRPNILVFLVDDMGTQDTSVPFYDTNGVPVVTAMNRIYRTPNMETLAARGMTFTTAYAMPVCTPTRSCLMTGMNAVRHHITSWTSVDGSENGLNTTPTHDSPAHWRRRGLDAGDVTLPRLLAAAGYRTILCGKAHFGAAPYFGADPRNIGFDVNIAGSAIGNPASYLGTANFGTGDHHVTGLAAYHGQDIFLTEALTSEMNTAIGAAVSNGVPFFAYMAHYAVHGPFTSDSRFAANYPGLSGNALNFATMLEGMDKSLGDILARLEALGVARDTLVVFLGDNGSDNPIAANNAPPLRGKKGTEWEGGVRVPLLVTWARPDAGNAFQQDLPIAGRSRCADIVAAFDLFPTLLGVGGVSYGGPADGYDLRPYFAGQAGHHRPQELLVHYPHDHNGDYFTTLREGDWKLIYRYAPGTFELYNLAADVGEANDLAAGQPERVMALARRMGRTLSASGAQWPVITATGADDPFALPLLPAVDVDGDGRSDNSEDANGNGVVDPGETDPDKADSDGDGTPDGAEIRLGTDPLNAVSAFRAFIAATGQVSTLRWPSQTGTRFRIEGAPPGNPDWQPDATNVSGDAGETRRRLNATTPARMYRVILE